MVTRRIPRNMRRDRWLWAAIASPVPADLVDFSASPEVVLGQYSTPGGEATLMLIEYPTPALAAEHLRRIDAAHHAAQPQAGIAAIENVGPFFDKRTGPIVAIAAGPLSQSDAQTLLGRGELRGQRHLEREHVFRQEEQHRQPAGQHHSSVHHRGCDLAGGGSRVWRRSRSAAAVFSWSGFSAVPIKIEFISLDLQRPRRRVSPARPGPTTDASNHS